MARKKRTEFHTFAMARNLLVFSNWLTARTFRLFLIETLTHISYMFSNFIFCSQSHSVFKWINGSQ